MPENGTSLAANSAARSGGQCSYQAWVSPQCGQATEVETSWEKTKPHEHV